MDVAGPAVLVTGGAGYIGSHICRALSEAGYLPVSYDNLDRGNAWAVKWGPLEQGELADKDRLRDLIGRYEPVAAIHCAALAYVGESISEPARYYRNNVAGSLSLLEVLAPDKIPIVFSSTCATYGIPDVLPISEETPQRPINPYGASKLMVEQLLRDFGTAYGLPWIALRYFNAAGASPDGEIGEHHVPETHLIPLVLSASAGELEALPVFGSDYPTPDGTCIRDYVHVCDLADAHILALQWLQEGKVSCAFNLGNGRGFSVREVIESAERITGRRVPVAYLERRAGDPPALFSKATKARTQLAWEPRLADIDTIIETAWNWHRRKSSVVNARARKPSQC